MKKLGLMSVLILALLLAACSGGASATPNALPTDAGLATEAGLATPLATETHAPTEAATAEPTLGATEAPTAAATTEAESGIVAAPYSLFTVASLTGDTDSTGTEAGTPAAETPVAGTPEAEGTTAAGTSTETANETDEMLLVRASELLGSRIVDMQNETIGTVEEVLVDESGVIQYVVFDASDYLEEMGGTDTTGGAEAGTPAPAGTNDQSTQVVGTIEAVTPEATTAAGTEAAVTPEATTAAGTEVAATPDAQATTTTDREGSGVMADEETILVFNGSADVLESQSLRLDETLLTSEGVMFTTIGTDTTADLAQLEGLLRVSQLTNFSVKNAQDEELGQVEEWIVDLEQGMVQYGVVDFGGFLGTTENTVAVPWEQFTLNAQGAAAAEATLTLDVDQDTLENAPVLDMSGWQSWPNPIPTDWETETSTFWETAS